MQKGLTVFYYLRLKEPRQAVDFRLWHDAGGLCSAVVVVVVEILRRLLLLSRCGLLFLLLLHFGSLYTSAKWREQILVLCYCFSLPAFVNNKPSWESGISRTGSGFRGQKTERFGVDSFFSSLFEGLANYAKEEGRERRRSSICFTKVVETSSFRLHFFARSFVVDATKAHTISLTNERNKLR